MRTPLAEETLIALAIRGEDEARSSGEIIDPLEVDKTMRLVRERGEEWAESVLMRKLTNRSPLYPHYLRFTAVEMKTLLLAAAMEGQLGEGERG